ncbi:MAG: hypothetical protein OEW67_03105 [Cyclobacteriaceae bacterium]|nr:hypothetical protein [Cyclobacteriaceae bacterium]
MKRLYFLTLVIFLSVCTSGWSQEDVEEVSKVDEKASESAEILLQVRQMYDQGRVHEIHPFIEDAISKDKMIKEDQIEAYKLLVLSYIYLDQSIEADRAMLELLKKNKLFAPNDTDPTELHHLYDTYRTWPIFRTGLFYGANLSITEVLQKNGIQNLGEGTNENGDYKSDWGVLNIGLLLEKDFLKRMITLETNFIYGTLTNQYAQSTADGRITRGSYEENEEPEIENQTFFGVNAIVQYHPFYKEYDYRSIKPYAFIGGSSNFLLSAKLNNSTSHKVEGGTTPTPRDAILYGNGAEEGNNTTIRNGDNYYLLGGIGAKWQSNTFHFFLSGQYSYGLNNLTVKNYNAADFRGYNDIKIHYFQINLGIVYSWYAPKKLTF